MYIKRSRNDTWCGQISLQNLIVGCTGFRWCMNCWMDSSPRCRYLHTVFWDYLFQVVTRETLCTEISSVFFFFYLNLRVRRGNARTVWDTSSLPMNKSKFNLQGLSTWLRYLLNWPNFLLACRYWPKTFVHKNDFPWFRGFLIEHLGNTVKSKSQWPMLIESLLVDRPFGHHPFIILHNGILSFTPLAD